MNNKEHNAKENILKAGKKEFLEKGFKSASLRNIVKEAGLTTGAFYGYYDSKEELFDELVGDKAKKLLDMYKEAQDKFEILPREQKPDNMGKISGDCMDRMVEYIYENFDAFKLLFCCAEGTKHENLIHDMVEIEIKATNDFMDVLKALGRKVPAIDRQLEHILISGMFDAFSEMVIHDVPKENAMRYEKELRTFYMAGWLKLFGLN